MIAPWFYSAAQVATEREFTPILQNKIIIYRDIKNNTEKMWYSTSDLKLQLTSSQSHWSRHFTEPTTDKQRPLKKENMQELFLYILNLFCHVIQNTGQVVYTTCLVV